MCSWAGACGGRTLPWDFGPPSQSIWSAKSHIGFWWISRYFKTDNNFVNCISYVYISENTQRHSWSLVEGPHEWTLGPCFGWHVCPFVWLSVCLLIKEWREPGRVENLAPPWKAHSPVLLLWAGMDLTVPSLSYHWRIPENMEKRSHNTNWLSAESQLFINAMMVNHSMHVDSSTLTISNN